MDETGPDTTGQGEWVTQAEAARRLRLSTKSVERRRQDERLLGRKEGREWRIWFPAADETATGQTSGQAGDKRPDSGQGARLDETPTPPDRLTTYLALRVEKLEQENGELKRQLGQRDAMLLALSAGVQTDTTDETGQRSWWRKLLDKLTPKPS